MRRSHNEILEPRNAVPVTIYLMLILIDLAANSLAFL